MKPEGSSPCNAGDKSGQSKDPLPLVIETVLRTGLTDIPSMLRKPEELQSGQVLEMRLFEDAQYRARVVKVVKDIMSTVTVTAEIEGYHESNMIAVTSKGHFLITINIPTEGKNYIIRYDFKAGAYRVDEILMEEQSVGSESPRALPWKGDK
jgi:hypothetical protein